MLAWIFAEERDIEQGTCEITNGGNEHGCNADD